MTSHACLDKILLFLVISNKIEDYLRQRFAHLSQSKTIIFIKHKYAIVESVFDDTKDKMDTKSSCVCKCSCVSPLTSNAKTSTTARR